MAKGTATIVVLVASTLALASRPAITATDLTAGRVVVCRPVAPDDRLALSFTHSMYGGEVREDYVPTRDDRLRRVSMSTANAAAAEYYAYEANVVREGDRYQVDVPAAEFAAIVVRVDRTGAHRLRVGDRTIDLLAATGDGHRVRLAVRSVSALARFLTGSC